MTRGTNASTIWTRSSDFTWNGVRVLRSARREARELNHNYVGTEHLLLGLISNRRAPAARILSSIGLKTDAVRAQIEVAVGRGVGVQHAPPFTPAAERILDLSEQSAVRRGAIRASDVDILASLLAFRDGAGVDVLQRLGVGGDPLEILTDHLSRVDPKIRIESLREEL
jgi:ATP-dependent Clp protease ATP-binding subunit ClpC